ncbi:MAG: hypothetical protein A2W18_07100 [Candidatus Muproteobacteria bacterium RBG_16_60_9]|uniref:Uncharacterized protein n=1 Tax=Candidatus Muproteobacteria bacterium RBG_16_60_9 TaxID=1817755 RepID=A0A1F6VI00_9PROT|nr:MAG: hypothetical protein A2W18_07100 [Candidatus Muproteobacteria bacterium RBG_16_60_9]
MHCNTSYAYDPQDRLLAITYPSGRVVNYARDGIGRIAGVGATVNGSATTVVSNRGYRADGMLKSQLFGNGFSETRAHDLQGRLLTQALPQITAAPAAVASVALAPDVLSPQAAGAGVLFTAQATGGSGNYSI